MFGSAALQPFLGLSGHGLLQFFGRVEVGDVDVGLERVWGLLVPGGAHLAQFWHLFYLLRDDWFGRVPDRLALERAGGLRCWEAALQVVSGRGIAQTILAAGLMRCVNLRDRNALHAQRASGLGCTCVGLPAPLHLFLGELDLLGLEIQVLWVRRGIAGRWAFWLHFIYK